MCIPNVESEDAFDRMVYEMPMHMSEPDTELREKLLCSAVALHIVVAIMRSVTLMVILYVANELPENVPRTCGVYW